MRTPSLLVLVSALCAGPAVAQETAFQVEQFEPLPAQSTNLGNLASTRTLEHLMPSFGLTFNFVDDPLQVRAIDEVTAKLVDDQLKAEIGAGIGLFGWANIGIMVPIVLLQSAEQNGTFGAVGEGAALADIRLVPKVRILNPEMAGGVGVALLLPVYLPTGDTGSFNGDGGVRLEPRLAVDWSHEIGLRVLANVAYQLRGEREALNYVNDDVLRYGLGVEAPTGLNELHATASLFGNASFGDGRDPANLSLAAANSEAQPLEAQFGARSSFGGVVLAHLGVGFGLTSDVGSPDFRVVAGVEWTPAISKDSDGDGIDNEADQCIDAAEDLDGVDDEDGCPDPDNDADGFSDGFDKCPNEAEDLDQFEDLDGCPEPDNDGDGILDDADLCPDVGGEAVLKGCPTEDNDGDGFSDHLEKCPAEAEDVDGFADDDGCPDPDNDADGIRDDLDQCPNQPEVYNQRDDEDGCPDRGDSSVVVTATEIQMVAPLTFGSGAKARSKGRRALNHVASALIVHSGIARLRVEVHTAGDSDADRELATKRSEWVVSYLVGRGVPAQRLEASATGGAQPVSADKPETADRVTFVIIEQAPMVLPTPEPPPAEEPAEAEEGAEGGGGFDFSGED